MSIWAGIFAPKGTPKEIIAKLAAALDKAMSGKDKQVVMEAANDATMVAATCEPSLVTVMVMDCVSEVGAARWCETNTRATTA